MTSSTVSMDLIKRDPSVSNWRAFLIQLTHGNLESLVIHLGSAEEVVYVTLREARSGGLAEATFAEALSEVVTSWHPRVLPEAPSQIRMVELVASFTPSNGLPKLIRFFQGPLIPYIKAIDQDGVGLLFSRKCVKALERYDFGLAGSIQTQLEREYINILNVLLKTKLGPHAFRRLVELGAIKHLDKELSILFSADPQETVRELLRGVIAMKSSVRDSILAHLFQVSVLAGKYDIFETQLTLLGCMLVHAAQNPVLQTSTEALPIYIEDERVWDFYFMKVRWDRGARTHA